VEEDQSEQPEQEQIVHKQAAELQQRPGSSLSHRLSAASSLNNSVEGLNEIGRRLKVTLNQEEGFFAIGKSSPNAQVFVLTITIAFARNLIRVRLF
jgi:hypothetical protein